MRALWSADAGVHAQRQPVSGAKLFHRRLPGAASGRGKGGGGESAAQRRRGCEQEDGAAKALGVGRAEQSGLAVVDQRRGATDADGDDRQPARLGLDDHLAVGVGAAAEEEHVGARVGARQVLSAEPAEEGRVLAEPLAQLRLLGPASGEQQVQAWVMAPCPQEGLGEQVDALFLRQPARVQHPQHAGEAAGVALCGAEAVRVDSALPASDALRLDTELGQRAIGSRARREDPGAGPEEDAEPEGDALGQRRVAGAQGGVGGEVGVVAADDRQAHDPRDKAGGDAAGARRCEVDGVVAALGEDVDDAGEIGEADPQALVEGDVDLGGGGQPAIDTGVGPDHLDLESGHPPLPHLRERVGDAVHRGDPVGDDRDPRRLAVAIRELRLLGSEEGGGGDVGDDRQAGREELRRRGSVLAAADRLDAGGHRLAEHPLVDAAGPARELAVAEVVRLHVRDQLLPTREVHRGQPGAEQGLGVLRPEVEAVGAAAGASLAHHPLGDPQNGTGVRRAARPVLRRLAARRRHADCEGPHSERDRRVRPLGGAALLPDCGRVAAAHQAQKLFRRRGEGRLGERPADVDAGVVIGAADPGTAVGVDVDRGRHVQLPGPGAVADLPDREQLGEPAPVSVLERLLDRIEGMGERAGDLALVQIGGAGLDVAGVRLQPLVVLRRDPVTEHVHGTRLAREPGGQLLGDEAVVAIGELQAALDRVVIGDRHEVHPAPLRELIDLLRRGGALRQSQRALYAQLRAL